jgi:hypothetical protein
MALGSTQPVTEPGGKERPARKTDNLAVIREPRRLTTLWAYTACYRDSFTVLPTLSAQYTIKRYHGHSIVTEHCIRIHNKVHSLDIMQAPAT